jgi:hypothetical protein
MVLRLWRKLGEPSVVETLPGAGGPGRPTPAPPFPARPGPPV